MNTQVYSLILPERIPLLRVSVIVLSVIGFIVFGHYMADWSKHKGDGPQCLRAGSTQFVVTPVTPAVMTLCRGDENRAGEYRFRS